MAVLTHPFGLFMIPQDSKTWQPFQMFEVRRLERAYRKHYKALHGRSVDGPHDLPPTHLSAPCLDDRPLFHTVGTLESKIHLSSHPFPLPPSLTGLPSGRTTRWW